MAKEKLSTKIINPEDLMIDVYRSGTDVRRGSHAVRITHKPTGTVVKSEDEVHVTLNEERAVEKLIEALKAQDAEARRKAGQDLP